MGQLELIVTRINCIVKIMAIVCLLLCGTGIHAVCDGSGRGMAG